MNIFQKAQLFLTLLFLGQKASFTFHAGKHVYSVSLVYTAEHQKLTIPEIISSVEEFLISSISPFSTTVGNTQITVSLVS